MTAQAESYLSPADYLAIERQAETKSEYFNGHVFAMTGASREHNLIAGNVLALIAGNVLAGLHGQLLDRSCEVYASDMRVKVSPTGMYTYPDIVVVCGEPELEDEHFDTLLNPTLLIEVLSESTERYDRGDKFAHYRKIESLAEYIMISQHEPRVEKYARQEDGTWSLRDYADLDSVLNLESIECRLPLSDIYAKINFDEPAEA